MPRTTSARMCTLRAPPKFPHTSGTAAKKPGFGSASTDLTGNPADSDTLPQVNLKEVRTMNARISSALTVFALAAVLWGISSAAPVDAAQREVVKFRLTKWKAAHFDSQVEARKHHATLTKIGCEAKQHAHGDHYDVSYRCPEWRSISLKTHAEAHQWETWLKSIGFETRHEH